MSNVKSTGNATYGCRAKSVSGTKYSKDTCIELLKQKKLFLESLCILRYPQRSDFSAEEVVAVKAFLGPWPRALEAAGLKPEKEISRKELNRRKHIASKRRLLSTRKGSNNFSAEDALKADESNIQTQSDIDDVIIK